MKIRTLEYFEKKFKRLLKKYPTIWKDYEKLLVALEENPKLGTALRRGAFKVRIAISAKGQGKSGGGRVITCLRTKSDKLYLLDIYDKSEQESIREAVLDALIDDVDALEKEEENEE